MVLLQRILEGDQHLPVYAPAGKSDRVEFPHPPALVSHHSYERLRT